MTQSKHTPGPWRLRNAETGCVYAGSALALVHIASAMYGVGKNEGQANARLIAAAPDGLALAEMVVRDVECYCDVDKTTADQGRTPCARCTAAAFIARATGDA